MDVSVILTYRCNSKCSMCNIWKFPTLPKEEVTLDTLSKIPEGVDYLNLTGGEPTLREDLLEIVDLLYPKAMKLEISSNGLKPEKIEPIIKKYPDVKIRFSLEGFEETNDSIRGEKNGYQTKLNGLLRLKELGGKDLGFAITIQDDNIDDLVDLFELCENHGFELATSTLHNGFQFHKSDNTPYDRLKVAISIEELITRMLKTYKIKNWFRAYLNLGLIAKVLGHDRMLKCTAATDFVFIDPWSDVYACNVRPDLKIGNLMTDKWLKIMNGEKINQIREKVFQCKHNCWIVGSAKTAMRHPKFAKIPKGGPLYWVIRNKLFLTFGKKINFQNYIDYSVVHTDEFISIRKSYLNENIKKNVQQKSDNPYDQFGHYWNK